MYVLVSEDGGNSNALLLVIVEMKTPRIHVSRRKVLWVCLGVLFDCHGKIVFILLSQLSFRLSQYETAVVSASEVKKNREKRD